MKGHRFFQFAFTLLILTGFSGCTFLYQKKPQKDVGLGSVDTSNISYRAVHEKIFAPKCIACHGSSGGINLESYAAVKRDLSAIERTTLIDKSMPKNGTLTNDESLLLSAWIQAGAPENADETPTPEPTPTKTKRALPDLSKISYAVVRERVFVSRCITCHGNSGGVNLESYASTRANLVAIERSAIINKTMPKSSPLSEVESAILASWINAGAPENPLGEPMPSPSPEEVLRPYFTSIKKNIIDNRCLNCHSSGGNASRVPLTSFKEILDSPRELVIPKNADESGLIIALERTDDKRMPPPSVGSPLTQKELLIVREWVEMGAPELENSAPVQDEIQRR